MDDTECLQTKHDNFKTSLKKIQKTKTELLIELRTKGIDTTKKRFLKDELLTLCAENDISVEKDGK